MPVLLITILTDGAIALVACGVPTWFVVSLIRKKQNRGNGPWPAMAAVLWLAWCIVVYGSFVEPRLLQVGRHEIVLTPQGTPPSQTLTVALISDTHLGIFRHEAWMRTVVNRVNELEPDVVLLAGDLASNLAGTEEFRPMRDLNAPLGKFAVLGNWDYRAGAVDVRKALGSQGVPLLLNRSVQLDVNGRTVSIIGLDDLKYGKPDIVEASKDVPEDAVKIVLVHNPDGVIQGDAVGADLVLAGHTHCGQIRIPSIGPVTPLPTTIGQKFDCGLFQFGPTQLFITPGVGESTARARFFDPPEISLLRIRF